MRTIIFAREKGGVGATTISTHVAVGLALHGKRVLFIDADPQADATASFGVEPSPALFNWLVHGGNFTTSSVQGLTLIPGHTDTRKIEREVGKDALRDALIEVAADFDICVIDSSPTPGDLQALLFATSGYAVIPTIPERLSLRGLVKASDHLAKAGVELAGIVPNMVRRQATHDKNLASLERLALRYPVWPAIGDSRDLREASQHQCMVWALYPKRTAARQMWAIVEKVEALP